MSDQFVTAFAGRRDGYQIPRALAETNRLAKFVTTFYLSERREQIAKTLLRRVPETFALRRARGVNDSLVRSMLGPELIEQAGRRMGAAPHRYWPMINRAISRAAADEASRAHAHLLLYEPYALPAFTREYDDFQPRKILFHFHPHPALEAEIYAEDVRRYPPESPWVTPDSGGRNTEADDAEHAWKYADAILCASTMTKRSLVHAGADPNHCTVIPYGIETNDEPPVRNQDGFFRALFVGSGIQRKGLHHLLEAWKRAKLPRSNELTVVARTVDPQIRAKLDGAERVKLVPGMGQADLKHAYAQASILVVPSLVEGFGQVYLEALAAGCPVLGTVNTGLPDLGDESNGVFLTEPSNIDALAAKLEWLAAGRLSDPQVSMAAWQTARSFPWSRFRSSLLKAVAE